MGDGGRKILNLRPAQAKVVRTYLKTKTKQNERAGDLAQVVESWLRKL
jgi:hypothetical protein